MAALSDLSACDGCRDPAVSPVVCPDEPLPASRYVDACARGEVVLGPSRIDRERGTPRRDAFRFTTAADGSYCLIVRNGSTDADRATAGWIRLDDSDVAHPDLFLRHLPGFQRSGEIAAGEHSLDVRVASGPGSFIEVEVRVAPAIPEELVAQGEVLAELEHGACLEFNRQQGLLGPDRAERLRRTALRFGIAPWQIRVYFNAYDVPIWLAPLPTWTSGLPETAPPESVARAWIEAHRALFRWADPRIDLDLIEVKSFEGGDRRVRFRQRVSDLPLDGSRVAVYLDAAGVAREVFGNFVPDVPASLAPALSASEAVSVLAAQVFSGETPVLVSGPSLVVVDLSAIRSDPGTRLAWRVTAGTETRAGTFWVDAADGSVLHEQAGVQGLFDVYYGDGPSAPLLARNLYPTDLCHTDEAYRSWCPDLLETLAFMDLRWSVVFGRDGWSGGGMPGRDGYPGIPAHDDYRVYISEMPLPRISRPGWVDDAAQFEFTATDGSLPGRALVMPIGFLHEDVVRHEFGHGFHQAEVSFVSEVDFPPPGYYRMIGEHIGDFWALGLGDRPFVMEDPLAVRREHGGGGCTENWWEGCSSDRCGCPVGCEEYTHLAYWDEWAPGRVPQAPDGHVNSCVLTKLAYLAMREEEQEAVGSVSWHGVSVSAPRKALAEQIFYKVFTRRLDLDATPLDYGLMYRDTAAAVASTCEEPDPPDVCLGGGEDRERTAAAVDAIGFWSDAYDLTMRNPDLTPESDLAAVGVEGAVWVFFARAVEDGLDRDGIRHDIYGARLADPFEPTAVPEAFNLTASPFAWEGIVHGPGAAAVGSEVYVAYVRGSAGPVRFLLGTAAETPLPVPSPFPLAGDSAESPALGAIGGQLVMVYVDADGATLKWLSSSSASPQDVGRTGEDPGGLLKVGHAPVLARVGSGASERLLLLYATGARPSGEDNVLAVRKFDPTDGGWSDEIRMPVLDYDVRPWDFARAWVDVETPPLMGSASRGIAAAWHLGRLQVFFPRRPGTGGYSRFRGSLLHLSALPADPALPAPLREYSGTRLVPFLARSEDRPAAVEMTDVAGHPILVLFWRWEKGPALPPRLSAAWKASD